MNHFLKWLWAGKSYLWLRFHYGVLEYRLPILRGRIQRAREHLWYLYKQHGRFRPNPVPEPVSPEVFAAQLGTVSVFENGKYIGTNMNSNLFNAREMLFNDGRMNGKKINNEVVIPSKLINFITVIDCPDKKPVTKKKK